MSNDLVVRGGTIITAADRFVADVGIRAGRIVEIGESLPRASQEIDAAGLQVLPGGVDVHTHLDVDVGTVHTAEDRKSTRLNSSHSQISYAVFCLKKKTPDPNTAPATDPVIG